MTSDPTSHSCCESEDEDDCKLRKLTGIIAEGILYGSNHKYFGKLNLFFNGNYISLLEENEDLISSLRKELRQTCKHVRTSPFRK